MNPIVELLASNAIIATVLALLIVAITQLWRNPHLAHALWLVVLVKLVTPSFVELPISLLPDRAEPSIAAQASSALNESGPAPVKTGLIDVPAAIEVVAHNEERRLLWPRGLAVAWLTGTLLLTQVAWRRHRKLSTLMRNSEPADYSLLAEAEMIAVQIGLDRCPSIRVSDARVSPFVTASLGQPTILLPSRLLNDLDKGQRRAVLAHELAHVRRGDHRVRLFELCVLGLHWWNPVVWWASHRLRQATEECCDALVIWALPKSRRSYGSALLRTIDFISEGDVESSLVGTAFGAPLFKHRIETIMKKQTCHRMSKPVWALVLLLGLTALPFSTTANPKPTASESSEKQQATAAAPTKPAVDDRRVIWNRLQFTLGTDDGDVERKTLKLTGENSFSSFEEVGAILRGNGIRLQNLRIVMGGDLKHVPAALGEIAKGMKVGEISQAVRIGDDYHVLQKTIDLNAESPRELALKDEKARLEYSAQRRLLLLDVKAAEIRALAAQEKADLLARVSKSDTDSVSEVRRAQVDAQLAEVEMERAKVAVELFEAQH